MSNRKIDSLILGIGVDLRGLTTNLKRAQSQIGNFTKSVNKITGGLGVAVGGMAAIQGVSALMTDIVGRTMKFEKALSNLQAVTRASGNQMRLLRENAQALGSTTQYTAIQVAELSKELAKLGFSTNEILKSSQAVLTLATATESDLGEAASTAGATLRGFGLDASEMTRVVDVMATSFSSSALDMDAFKESMKIVAPVAKTAGVSIEMASAMLGKLADIGIKGSMAGTSMKRILVEMAKTGKPAALAFQEVASQGVSLAGAEALVGKNAMVALNALSSMTGEVALMTEEFNKAAGAGEEMASVMEDNLMGDLRKLESAWDGLVNSSNGLTDALRTQYQMWTKVTNWLSGTEETTNDLQQANVDLFTSMMDGSAAAEIKMKRLAEAAQKELLLIREREQAYRDFVIQQSKVDMELAWWRVQKPMEEANKKLDYHRRALAQLRSEYDMAGEAMAAIHADIAGSDFTVTDETADQSNEAIKSVEAQTAAEKDKQKMEKQGLQLAGQLGAALAMQGDERKKAARQALRANAATILSDMIASAVKTIPFPLNIAAAGAAAFAGNKIIDTLIPKLAQGGLAMGPTLAMVGDNTRSDLNPEVIAPLNKLEKIIGGGNGMSINVNGFVGDEQKLGREIGRILQTYRGGIR